MTLPQRLANNAQLGELAKRLDGIVSIRKAEGSDDDLTYSALIRQLPCLRCGLEEFTEAAHVRFASGAHGKASGTGKKPQARWLVPLCGACHRVDKDSQHNVGERAFWAAVSINPLLIAERLWAQRGDVVAMRAVIIQAIAERG